MKFDFGTQSSWAPGHQLRWRDLLPSPSHVPLGCPTHWSSPPTHGCAWCSPREAKKKWTVRWNVWLFSEAWSFISETLRCRSATVSLRSETSNHFKMVTDLGWLTWGFHCTPTKLANLNPKNLRKLWIVLAFISSCDLLEVWKITGNSCERMISIRTWGSAMSFQTKALESAL